MKKTIIFIMFLVLLSKTLGFAREVVLSYFYGASNISDAYIIALTVPAALFIFIGIGLQTTFIPMYLSVQKDSGEQAAVRFMKKVISLLFVISTAIVVLVLFFAEYLVFLFASGFDVETLDLAVTLTRITVFAIYCTGIIYIFQGFLKINNNFIAPHLDPIPLNILLILSIAASAHFGYLTLGYGKLVAVLAQIIFLLPFVYSKGFRFKVDLDFQDKHVRRMFVLAIPIMLGTAVNQINILVDRTLASQIAVGGISALNYSARLNKFVQGIFVLAVTTVLFATISKMAAKGNIAGLKKVLSQAVVGISVMVIPATVGAMVLSEPIISMLFERGAFDSEAVAVTANSLFYYSIGMIGLGLREVYSRAFYALQDTKTPMINASIAIVLNIVLNFILSRFLGIGGLALATSIAGVFCTVLLVLSLRKKIGPIGIKSSLVSLVKVFFSSCVMGLCVYYLYGNLLTRLTSDNVVLIVTIAAGLVLYISMIYFMRIKEVDVIVAEVKVKLAKLKQR